MPLYHPGGPPCPVATGKPHCSSCSRHRLQQCVLKSATASYAVLPVDMHTQYPSSCAAAAVHASMAAVLLLSAPCLGSGRPTPASHWRCE
jgi:hypothetical protein